MLTQESWAWQILRVQEIKFQSAMIKHSQERALSVSNVSWVIDEMDHGVLRIVLNLKKPSCAGRREECTSQPAGSDKVQDDGC